MEDSKLDQVSGIKLNERRQMDSGPDSGNYSKLKTSQYLSSLYSREMRLVEYLSVILTIPLISLMLSWVAYYGLFFFRLGSMTMCLLGILTADFVSGVIHWAADSYGSVDMPILGKTLLRSFRQHHLDPLDMTTHDFIYTNGENFLVTAPLFAILLFHVLTLNRSQISASYPRIVFFAFFLTFAAFTNQIHKWSHMHNGLPKFAEFLQNCRIILTRRQHHFHHIAPHDTYFCITTGWMNYPLEVIYFFPMLEYIILQVFKVHPRIDDLQWAKK